MDSNKFQMTFKESQTGAEIEKHIRVVDPYKAFPNEYFANALAGRYYCDSM